MPTIVKPRPLECEYCDHVSESMAEVKRHLATHPKDERALQCPYCPKVVVNHAGVYRSHVNSHEVFERGDLFWPRVNQDGPIPPAAPELGKCWLWTGPKDRGYGVMHAPNRTTVSAQAYSYTKRVGPIPEGWEVDHLCLVRACVNPAHLEAVPKAENGRRAHRRPENWLNCEVCGRRMNRGNIKRHMRSKHPAWVSQGASESAT